MCTSTIVHQSRTVPLRYEQHPENSHRLPIQDRCHDVSLLALAESGFFVVFLGAGGVELSTRVRCRVCGGKTCCGLKANLD